MENSTIEGLHSLTCKGSQSAWISSHFLIVAVLGEQRQQDFLQVFVMSMSMHPPLSSRNQEKAVLSDSDSLERKRNQHRVVWEMDRDLLD